MSEIKNDEKMWIEKYRPNEISDVIANDYNIKTISAFIKNKNIPNLLFYGPPGTGKTTTALIISKLLNGEQSPLLTLELNASDSRGIDTVRNEIKSFSQSSKIFSKSNATKFIILDEADAMTNTAQFALRRIIEDSTSNVRFCFICNHVNKIIPAIQSRCTRFRFALLEEKAIFDRLKFICLKENVKFTENGLKSIITLSSGDMRNCINLLQSTFFGYKNITEKIVYDCAGQPSSEDVDQIFNILRDDFCASVEWVKKFRLKKGLSLSVLVKILHQKILQVDFLKDRDLLNLIIGLSQIEYRLSKGCSEEIQSCYLTALFQNIQI